MVAAVVAAFGLLTPALTTAFTDIASKITGAISMRAFRPGPEALFGDAMLNAIEVILICLVAQAALTDLAMRKIPNVLILSGLLLALILHLLSGQPGPRCRSGWPALRRLFYSCRCICCAAWPPATSS
jgi:hypothetical protein